MPPAAESEEGMDMELLEEEEEQAPRRGGKGKGKGARKRGKEKDKDNDEDEEEERPAKKRQSDASSAAANSEAGGGSGGSAGEEEDDDDDDEEEDDGEDDGDEQAAGVRKTINMPGRSAETGVIVKIYCENFMCHRKLSVTLCPNVNFINGQNGSGKSAILAALQICLGARANVTHRGSKLSDMIRQGHNGSAIVRVSLLNKGSDPFKPQQYGEYITVERKIERNGASSYALLKGNPHSDSPKYTVVSKHREELTNMLDAFNIQIDNPCALLDQENAKRFIQGDATEKYKFFEKATDIERVKRTIRETSERIARTEEQLEVQEEQLPLVKATWKQLEKLRLDMESLERVEEDIKKARADIAWIYHRDNLTQTQGVAEQVATLEKQVKKLAEELEKAEAEQKEKSGASEGMEAESETIKAQIEDAKRTMREVRKQSKGLKDKLNAKEAQIKEKVGAIKRSGQAKKEAQRKMDDERAKLASQAEQEIGPKVARVREIEDELEAAEKEAVEVKDQYEKLVRDRKRLIEESERLRREMQDDSVRANELGQEKDRLSKAQGELAGYGREVEYLCKEIKKAEKRFKQPPLGPLGLHIALRGDAQEWAGPVENAIGPAITHFVVTSHEDRQLLQDLCRRCNCGWVTIVTMPAGQAKHRVREPNARNIKPVTHCITVEEPAVWNTLVDWAKIDTSAVFRTRHDAERAFVLDGQGKKRYPYPIRNGYHLDDYQTEVLAGGTISTRFVNKHKNARRKLGVDRSQMIRDIDREVAAFTATFQEKGQRVKEIQAGVKQIEQQMSKLKADNNRVQKQLKLLKDEKTELDEEIAEAQASVSAAASATQAGQLDDLQGEIEDAEEEIKAAQAAIAQLKEQKKALEEELEPLAQKEQNEAKRNKHLDTKLQHELARMETVVNEIDESMQTVKKYKKRLQTAEANLAAKRKELEKLETADVDNLEKVKDYTRQLLPDWDGEELHPEMSAADLKKHILVLEKRKEREAERHGTSDSIEVIREKEKRAKQTFVVMMKDMLKIKEIKEKLEGAVDARETRLRKMRKFIVRRATKAFEHILLHRGSGGALKFDFKQKQLNLNVQKDANDETTLSTNVKELSGGERSFTTLALLLSLGESIECPFRALDEFDIFMDAVARKIALSKLIETARSEQMRHRQFIFITPQDLSAVQKYVGDDFKIHKMRPPERSDRGLQQTTLN